MKKWNLSLNSWKQIHQESIPHSNWFKLLLDEYQNGTIIYRLVLVSSGIKYPTILIWLQVILALHQYLHGKDLR